MRAYYWNGNWLRFVCAGLILVAGCANQANDLSETGNFLESAKGDFEVNITLRRKEQLF